MHESPLDLDQIRLYFRDNVTAILKSQIRTPAEVLTWTHQLLADCQCIISEWRSSDVLQSSDQTVPTTPSDGQSLVEDSLGPAGSELSSYSTPQHEPEHSSAVEDNQVDAFLASAAESKKYGFSACTKSKIRGNPDTP